MGLGGEQTFVLALLPVERFDLRPREPGVDGGAEARVAAEASGERDVRQFYREAAPKLLKRAQLVQLEHSIQAVAARGAAGDDEAGAFEIAEHPRRPARSGGRIADGYGFHARDLNTSVSRIAGARATVAVLEPHHIIEMRCRHLNDGRVFEGGDAVDRARTESEGRPGRDDLHLQDGVAGRPELELGPPGLNEPRLVLMPVELER